jgi:hypothetical protein
VLSGGSGFTASDRAILALKVQPELRPVRKHPMANPEHKERELEDANDFVKLWPEWADDRPSVCQNESPDILLRFRSGRVVGLEHTRLMNEAIAAADAVVQRMYAEIRSAVDKANVFGARIIPIFDNENIRSLKHRERQHAIAAIVDLARKVVRSRGSDSAANRTGTTFVEEELRALGIRGLLRLTIDSVVNGRALLGQQLPHTPPTFVEECVAAKDRKLSSYRSRNPDVTEFWLLLVSGYGAGDPDWHRVRRAKPRSGFDRTFFLRYTSGLVSAYEIGRDASRVNVWRSDLRDARRNS